MPPLPDDILPIQPEITPRSVVVLDASEGLIRRMLSQWPSYSEISLSVFGGQVLLEFAKKGKRALPPVGSILSLFDCEGGAILL